MNVGKRISAQKSAVEDLYRRYIQLRGSSTDGVDLSVLGQQVEAMKQGKFTLVVAGEVSSGKSSFINALMGEEILPSSVLQTTSAIVEIYKSTDREIEVIFADGHREKIIDDPATRVDDELTQGLAKICAIQEKYRAIPTTVINDFLIEGTTEVPLDVLEKKSGIRLQGKQGLIEEYIREYEGLDKIPKEILFAYPFKYAFSDIRLVDTPGVNARGGLQELTFNYIRGANAILFIHNIMPVESESFREFVETCVPNHSLKTLFLVLSHAGEHVEDDVRQLLSEARNIYTEMDPRKVVAIDSVLRIASLELTRRSLNEVMKNAKMKKMLSEYVMDADGDHDAVRSAIDKISNFDELEQIIEEFSMRAPSLQLIQILKSICTGIENLLGGWQEGIRLRRKKMEDPQEFENRIALINDALGKYKLAMYEFSRQVEKRYISAAGETELKLDRVKEKYEIAFNSASSKDHLLKHMSDFQFDCADLLDHLTKLIREEYAKEMRRIGGQLSATHDVILPKLDMAGLEEKARNEAFVEVEKIVPGGSGFKYEVGKGVRKALNWAGDLLGRSSIADDVIGNWGKDKKVKERVLDQSLFLNKLKAKAISSVLVYANYIEGLCRNVVKKYDPIFRTSLAKVVTENEEELETLKLKKQECGEIVDEIAKLEDLLNRGKDLDQNVRNLMEDLQ